MYYSKFLKFIELIITNELSLCNLNDRLIIEDFSNGKGANAIKKVIPIDISYDEYKNIIDLWN